MARKELSKSVDFLHEYFKFIEECRERHNTHDLCKLKSYRDVKHYRCERERTYKKLEIHHVIPKTFGGLSCDPFNLVLLEPNEHCKAHFLLSLGLYQHRYFNAIHKHNYFTCNGVFKTLQECVKDRLFGKIRIEVAFDSKENISMTLLEAGKMMCIVSHCSYMVETNALYSVTKALTAGLKKDNVFGYKWKLDIPTFADQTPLSYYFEEYLKQMMLLCDISPDTIQKPLLDKNRIPKEPNVIAHLPLPTLEKLSSQPPSLEQREVTLNRFENFFGLKKVVNDN